MSRKSSTEKTVRDIRRRTRKQYSAEEKIRIVLEGLRGEDTVAELCRREGINPNIYYRWSKEFLEAGKKRLAGDTAREATSDEVKELRAEASALKETLGEVVMENKLLKKSVLGDGGTIHEVLRIRKGRDHWPSAGLQPVGEADAGQTGYSPFDLLQLAEAVSSRRR